MTDTIIAKDTIHIEIGDDHSYNSTVVAIGRAGENTITQLEITIPEELNTFWAYLDFKKPKGYKHKTPRLTIENNKIEYDVPSSLINEAGNLEVQLVLQNENGDIWKSNVHKYVVLKSVDAVDDIPFQEDFITEAQKTLDEMQETLADIESGAGVVDTTLFANAIQNTVSGNVVAVNDVSALKHTVKVQLSDNRNGVLFDTPTPSTDSEKIEYHDSVAIRVKMELKDNTTYTVQFKCNKVGVGMHHHPLLANGYRGDYVTTGNIQTVTFTTGELSGEYPPQHLYNDGYWEILCYDTFAPTDIEFTNLTISEGTTITNVIDFTKVKLYRYGGNSSIDRIEYTPNADGTVDVKSLSPYMTLETDNGNVLISATYNLDTKNYIDKQFENFVNVSEVGV